MKKAISRLFTLLLLMGYITPFIQMNMRIEEESIQIFDVATESVTQYDWAMHGYNPTGISASPSTLPNQNTTSWISDLPGATVWSYPIEAEGRVFLGAGGHLNAWNETDGTFLWNFKAPDQPGYPRNAAADNGMVFFGTAEPGGYGSIYALNASTGELIWNFTTQGEIRAPIVAEGRLYFGDEISPPPAKIRCLNATTGVQIWEYATQDKGIIVATANGKIFATCGHWETAANARIYCLDMYNGTHVWNVNVNRDMTGGISVASGKVYVTVGNENANCIVLALNASDGSEIWGNNYSNGYAGRTAVADGKLFVGMGGSGRGVYALNETDGSEIWTFPFPSGSGPRGGPVIGGNKVFFAMYDPANLICALNTTNGSMVWSYQLAGGVHSWSSAVANERLIVADHWDHKIYAFGSPRHDIAVINVNADKSEVAQGQETSIEVVSSNRGSYTETFNVTVFANASQIGKQLVTSLSPGASETQIFTWNTTGFSLGSYTISAVADVVINETDTSDNTYINGVVEVRLPIHDVAVVDVSPESYVVPRGLDLDIDVTVENQGDFTETFNVTVCYDGNIIEKQETTVASMSSTILIFTWNTTGVPLGDYLINASASIVADEIDTDDNTYLDGLIAVIGVGDVAVVDVTPLKTVVFQNHSMSINSTIENHGDRTETFDVTANYADNTFRFSTIQPTDTTVYLEPTNITGISINDTFVMNIRVHNVIDLFAWEIVLYYQNDVLSAIDANKGSFLDSGGPVYFVTDSGPTIGTGVWNSYNMTHGRIHLGATLVGNLPGVSGNGIIGSIEFRLLAQGNSTLAFKRTEVGPDPFGVLLLDRHIDEISYEIVNGWIAPTGYYPIETQTVNLENMTSTTITFAWNTTGLAKGNYTIRVVAEVVPGEMDIADNSMTDGWVIVAMVGDLTGPDGWPDGKCDIRDIALIAKYYGQDVPPAPPNCDITGPIIGVPDGTIDIRDIATVAKHFGEVDP